MNTIITQQQSFSELPQLTPTAKSETSVKKRHSRFTTLNGGCEEGNVSLADRSNIPSMTEERTSTDSDWIEYYYPDDEFKERGQQELHPSNVKVISGIEHRAVAQTEYEHNSLYSQDSDSIEMIFQPTFDIQNHIPTKRPLPSIPSLPNIEEENFDSGNDSMATFIGYDDMESISQPQSQSQVLSQSQAANSEKDSRRTSPATSSSPISNWWKRVCRKVSKAIKSPKVKQFRKSVFGMSTGTVPVSEYSPQPVNDGDWELPEIELGSWCR
jgi:hypothetical protein